ncbi:hypothetical protein VTK26DRAFT_4610 [Humicola hyalothermophila]
MRVLIGRRAFRRHAGGRPGEGNGKMSVWGKQMLCFELTSGEPPSMGRLMLFAKRLVPHFRRRNCCKLSRDTVAPVAAASWRRWQRPTKVGRN